ncbi:MAG: hypothetical protein ACX98W_04995 [bacterium]
MTTPLQRLEGIWRWRQVSVWAPVLWLPLLLHGLASGHAAIAFAVGLSGVVFAALTRGVVWLGRCPGCETRWRDSREGFQTVWDEAACRACGLSLFESRRRARAARQRLSSRSASSRPAPARSASPSRVPSARGSSTRET